MMMTMMMVDVHLTTAGRWALMCRPFYVLKQNKQHSDVEVVIAIGGFKAERVHCGDKGGGYRTNAPAEVAFPPPFHHDELSTAIPLPFSVLPLPFSGDPPLPSYSRWSSG